MLEYGNYIQLCDSVIASDTSKREGLGWFCSAAVPCGGVNTRDGKAGGSELILQGKTDPPWSPWGWGEVQTPTRSIRAPTTIINPLEYPEQTLSWNRLTPVPQGMALPKRNFNLEEYLHLQFLLAVINQEWNARFQPFPLCCGLQIHQKPNWAKNDGVGLETGATQSRPMSQGSEELWLKYAVN